MEVGPDPGYRSCRSSRQDGWPFGGCGQPMVPPDPPLHGGDQPRHLSHLSLPSARNHPRQDSFSGYRGEDGKDRKHPDELDERKTIERTIGVGSGRGTFHRTDWRRDRTGRIMAMAMKPTIPTRVRISTGSSAPVSPLIRCPRRS